ncbi:MAG: hypothetical protein FWB86_08285 [Treponema sp.]|nr:hypothetical protein [Treponema sp.]MCL2251796.1 hypothetical protein [Treponema sp.]
MERKAILQMIGLLKPKFYKDGNAWCFRFGEDIASGVCGFGDTPYEAARAFYKNFMSEQIKIVSLT